MLTPAQPAISNHGLETTVYRPFVLVDQFIARRVPLSHVTCVARLQNEIAPCKCLIQYEKWHIEREKGSANDPKCLQYNSEVAKKSVSARRDLDGSETL